jgi:hypothetical protein
MTLDSTPTVSFPAGGDEVTAGEGNPLTLDALNFLPP